MTDNLRLWFYLDCVQFFESAGWMGQLLTRRNIDQRMCGSNPTCLIKKLKSDSNPHEFLQLHRNATSHYGVCPTLAINLFLALFLLSFSSPIAWQASRHELLSKWTSFAFIVSSEDRIAEWRFSLSTVINLKASKVSQTCDKFTSPKSAFLSTLSLFYGRKLTFFAFHAEFVFILAIFRVYYGSYAVYTGIHKCYILIDLFSYRNLECINMISFNAFFSLKFWISKKLLLWKFCFLLKFSYVGVSYEFCYFLVVFWVYQKIAFTLNIISLYVLNDFTTVHQSFLIFGFQIFKITAKLKAIGLKQKAQFLINIM